MRPEPVMRRKLLCPKLPRKMQHLNLVGKRIAINKKIYSHTKNYFKKGRRRTVGLNL
jgi:hypothetical protein